MSTLPKGVIFDMDGVLVDSEPFICKAACMMFAEHGVKVQPEDFIQFTGMGENRYLGGVAAKHNFTIDIERDKKRTYDIYGEIVKGKLEPLAGVHEFIDRCRKLGKKLAVASSADRRKVEINLKEIKVPFETFDAVIVAEDVTQKKPSPEIFMAAAKRIGLDPKDCLVIEDAVSGVQAAKAAGAKCLALTTSFPKEKLSKADWVAATLADAGDDILNWR